MFRVRLHVAVLTMHALQPAAHCQPDASMSLSDQAPIAAGPVAALPVHLPCEEWQDGVGEPCGRTAGFHRCGC